MSQEEYELPVSEIKKIIDEHLQTKRYATKAEVSEMKVMCEALARTSGSSEGIDVPAREQHNPIQGFFPKRGCKDCGVVEDNPSYDKDAEYFCSDCGYPFGSERDARRAPKCPACGSTADALYRPSRGR